MSALSIFPVVSTIEYWGGKLAAHPHRKRFLLTKLFELLVFLTHGKCNTKAGSFVDFPPRIGYTPIDAPSLCLVVPVYSRTPQDISNLSRLLLSIERQSLRPQEILIIDDCSPLDFAYPSSVSVVRLEENSGPAKARNTGMKRALESGSDIIAFADSDCILSEKWTESIIQSFSACADFHILSGDTSAYDSCWLGKYHDINGTLNGRKFVDSDRLLYGTTANMAITKAVASHVNFNKNFPLAAGEDIEFSFRANSLGYAIKHEPAMKVLHNYGYGNGSLRDLRRFGKQFARYAAGEKLLLSEVPEYYAYLKKTEEISSAGSLCWE